MSDEQARRAERDAADDAQAAERVRHERCRRGECCAHVGDTVPLGTRLGRVGFCAPPGLPGQCCGAVFLRRCAWSASRLCAACCDAHACADAVPPGEGVPVTLEVTEDSNGVVSLEVSEGE